MDQRMEQKIDEIVEQMTIEEKIAQLQQLATLATPPDILEELKNTGDIGSFLHLLGAETKPYLDAAKKNRFHISPIFGVDAIHGHAVVKEAVIFPSQLAMACSWNEELVQEMGRVTAREVAADGLDWVFSPVLCLGRDLRWGRIDETFGEDPLLVSRLGAAIIRGYQQDGQIAACAKHYFGYGEATGGRDAYDSMITERSAREIFLKPFQAAIEAGCMTVMTSYGSIDGESLTTSKFWLTDVLKEEYGFEGFVVTDFDNVNSLVVGNGSSQSVAENVMEASAMAIEAGNDMCMRTYEFITAAVEAVKQGKLSEERVNDAVRRILTVKERLGLLDEQKQRPSREVIGCKEHKEVNKKLTLESTVLLKNDGILPLKTVKKIAVIGPNADDIRAQYGDWTYFSHPGPNPNATEKTDAFTILRGVKEVFAQSEIVYAQGCDLQGQTQNEEGILQEAVRVAKECDVVIAVLGDNLNWNGEWHDIAQPVLRGRQEELVRRVFEVNQNIVVVLVNGKPLVLGGMIPYCRAIIETFNGGDECGLAVAKQLKGEENFSGKLPISFPAAVGIGPSYYNQYSYWHGGKYCDCEIQSPYPFGFGLSYSSFEYGELSLSQKEAKLCDTVTLSCNVTNISAVDGKEVVQLYFKDKVCKMLTPVRTLLDYKKVFISAGETAKIAFEIPVEKLGYYDRNCKYHVDAGEFIFYVSGDGVNFVQTTITVVS